jgi:hypothetical protein
MRWIGGYWGMALSATHNYRDNRIGAIIAFDRRKTRRHRVLKDARIILGNGRSTMTCVVRDLSEIGARLQAPFTPDLPQSFMLMISGDGTMVPVKRVWWMGSQMGVKFTGKFLPAPGK